MTDSETAWGLNPGAASRLGGYITKDISPTILATTGDNKPAVCYAKDIVVYDGSQVTCPVNSVNPQPGDPCHTLHNDSRNYLVISLEGNGARPTHKGPGFAESDAMFTLNTIERHQVCYEKPKCEEPVCFIPYGSRLGSNSDGKASTMTRIDYKFPQCVAYLMDAMESNSMKSKNPRSGFRQSDVSKCLDTTCCNPSCNQGGVIVVQDNVKSDKQSNDDEITLFGVDCRNADIGKKAQTIQANAAHSLNGLPCAVYAVDNHPNDSRMSIAKNGKIQALTSRMGTGGNNVPCVVESWGASTGYYQQYVKNGTPTLLARDYKDPPIICIENKEHET